ncbi:hypothetical protein L0F51_03855 [Afifella sp. H1R]|uniref:hypothetical protein n=1 Tax=Afifella sp. H1R TaxID=2908841 RepID=UPI001F1EE0EA|nr:hypothetical protein [Afifella sp. H1R]MCF1502900.1 hypothetical protein [Afifella sp. H1R]
MLRVNNLVGFGARRRGPLAPAYLHYRIRCLGFSAPYWWRVREFEIYPETGLGGTKLTGTASASTARSGEQASRAVDNSAATYWGATTTGGANVGQWLRITLPEAAIAMSARFQVYAGHDANLVAWEGSDDAVDWTVLDEQPGTSTDQAWVNFERQ